MAGIKISDNESVVYTTTESPILYRSTKYDIPFEVGSYVSHTDDLLSDHNTIVEYPVHVSGTYNIDLVYDLPKMDYLTSGYLQLYHNLTWNFSNIFYQGSPYSSCVANMGNPYVVGLMPVGLSMSAYGYGADSWMLSYNGVTQMSSTVRSILNFNDYACDQPLRVSVSIAVPFSITFVLHKTEVITSQSFLTDLLICKIMHSSLTNNLYINYAKKPINGQLGDINDNVDRVNGSVKDNTAAVDKNTDAVKEQTKEQKGFFASVLDWFLNFPTMLLRIVVPSDDVFSRFMTDMKDFLFDRLGFLSYPFELIGKMLDLVTNTSAEPVIKLPGFKIMGNVVWSEQKYDLRGTFDDHFGEILSALRVGTSVIMIGAFLLFCQRKFDEVLGGRGD